MLKVMLKLNSQIIYYNQMKYLDKNTAIIKVQWPRHKWIMNEMANPSHIFRTLACSWSPWKTARNTTLWVSSPYSQNTTL